MGSCCSTLVPKYAQHIESLLPLPLSKAEVKTMGGVLAQDDVTKWKTRVSTSDMTAYAKAMPDKLALMASYCQKKIKAELARGRMRFAAIYMLALIALVEACHSDEQLSLYDSSVCNSMLLLFEHPNHELQILAAQCLCALLKAQADPGSNSHNRRLPVSSVYSSSDYSKYALFYPFVLKMASRNPSSSVLSQLGASAQKLFRDKDKEVTKAHQRSTSQSNNEPQTPKPDGGSTGGPSNVPLSKRKRVKDLAELEVMAGANPHQRGSSLSLNRNGSNVAPTPAASDKGEKSVQLNDPAGAEPTEDPTKQRISLWRSRYFGLKALSYLFQYNKDTSASFSRLTEILPILLVNFPKTKRALKAVVKEYDADTMNRIDETYKHFHSSSSSEEKTAVAVPATENNIASSPVLNNQSSAVNLGTKKGDDLSSKTGITLLHVQLFAYDALIALCNLPSVSLHTAVIYKEVFHWLDQSQTILSRTTMQGIPTAGAALTVPQPTGAGIAATPSTAAVAGPTPTTPSGWEDLYFTSHFFIDVLCKQLPFENGSIDQLVFALMQHMEAMEEKEGGLVPSKRGSKMIEEVLTPIELIGEESKSQAAATLAGTAPVATPSTPQKEKTTLAQDIKQLFKKKSPLSIIGRGSAASRQIKLTQNAILSLLNNLLFQAGDMYSNDAPSAAASISTGVTRAFSGSSVDEPHGSRLVLMNAQFLTESYLAHVQSAARSVDLLKRIQARGSVSAPSLANLGASGTMSASSSSIAAGADQAQLEYEASLEASLSLSVDFLHSYTRVFPQLFAQRFYSFNDILSCLSYMVSRAMKSSGVSEASHATKSTYLDACYAMSIGLLKWGSGRTTGAAEIDSMADDLYSLDQSNLSSATLYETLINSILSCVACEIDADLRAQTYKILESVLMCMGGFGGRWSALPSSSLLLNQVATLGSSWGNLSGVSLARNTSGNPSLDAGTSAPAHTSSLEVPGARDEEKSQVSRSGANTLESSAVVGGSGIEPSPSPHHGVSAFSDRGSLSASGSTTKADLRARRIPQIFASCMDVKTNSANGGSNSASALTSHSALLSTQYHRWIYSVIYYEITACFSSIPPAAAGAVAADGSSSSSMPLPKDLTPFQIAGGILKPRGRGHTSNENIILCFQILTLLLLQRHGSNSNVGAGRSGNDPVTIQQILSLQLPLMLRVNTYLTSTNSEEKFYLKTAQNLKLQSFLYTYLFFVSKLLLLNVDSHWLRQQSVNLEEYLLTVQSDRTRKGEGAGSELEGSWLYGLVENQPAVLGQGSVTEINTNFDNEQLVAILAKLLVEKPVGSNGESVLSGGANNSAADETLDQLIAAQQAHLSDPTSFEPFNLAFLLPEQSLREKSDRENSTSWAPSRFTGAQPDGGADESMRHGPASSSPAELAGAAAISASAIDLEFGSHTPRTQYSPALRSKMAGGPSGSPSLRALDLGPNAGATFTGSSTLGPIEASPQPQQSAADILLEIDQQSFSSISSLAAKTSLKQQVQFEQFMMELDTHTAANPQSINAIAQAIAHQKKPSSSAGVSLLNDESKVAPAAAATSSTSTSHSSSDAIAKANAFIYDLNSKSDGFDLTRPASNSTLELSFPQLASFDMYLHSELDA